MFNILHYFVILHIRKFLLQGSLSYYLIKACGVFGFDSMLTTVCICVGGKNAGFCQEKVCVRLGECLNESWSECGGRTGGMWGDSLQYTVNGKG